MANKIPSQVGEWKVERSPVRGVQWTATHSEWERGDIGGGESGPARAGGPITAWGGTVVAMLVVIIEIEAEGDFGAFGAAVELKFGGDGDFNLEAEELASALLSLCEIAVADGTDRLVAAIEDAMVAFARGES